MKPNQFKLRIFHLHEDHFSGALFMVTGPRCYNPDQSKRRWRRYFNSLGEAKAYLERRIIELINYGANYDALDPASHMDAVRALRLLNEEAPELSLFDAVKLAIKTHFSVKRAPSVGALIADLIREKEIAVADGRYEANSLTYLRKNLSIFEAAIGAKVNIALITADDIREFLAGLEGGPRTRVCRYDAIRLLFNVAVKRGLLKSSPLLGVEAPRVPMKVPGILTPDEARRWLTAVMQEAPEFLGYYVLSLFAGIRSAEITRLSWTQVDLDECIVYLPGALTKTGIARTVQLSPNAVLWLQCCQREGMVLSKTLVDSRWWVRKKLLAIVGFTRWPHNGGRHSFVSYHYAWHRNEHYTASEAGHDVRILRRFYKAVVTRKQAEQYWSIVPPGGATGAGSNVIPMTGTSSATEGVSIATWPVLAPSA